MLMPVSVCTVSVIRVLKLIFFEMFGFGEDNVTKVVSDFVTRHSNGPLPGVGEFEELLLNHVAH